MASIPALLAAARVPATTVNWAGVQEVSVEQWCEFMGSLIGLAVSFEYSETAIQRVACETTLYRQIVDCSQAVDWHDGMLRMVRARYPDLGAAWQLAPGRALATALRSGIHGSAARVRRDP